MDGWVGGMRISESCSAVALHYIRGPPGSTVYYRVSAGRIWTNNRMQLLLRVLLQQKVHVPISPPSAFEIEIKGRGDGG